MPRPFLIACIITCALSIPAIAQPPQTPEDSSVVRALLGAKMPIELFITDMLTGNCARDSVQLGIHVLPDGSLSPWMPRDTCTPLEAYMPLKGILSHEVKVNKATDATGVFVSLLLLRDGDQYVVQDSVAMTHKGEARSMESVVAAIRKQEPSLRPLYESLLQRDNAARGNVKAKLGIDHTGSIVTCTVVGGSITDTQFLGELTTTVKAWKLGGDGWDELTEVVYPFSFRP